jgi:hypothetical protein
MRVQEWDRWVTDLLVADDHDEIVAIRPCTGKEPAAPTRFEVKFASGASVFVMAARVEGPGISRHAEYELPKEALK